MEGIKKLNHGIAGVPKSTTSGYEGGVRKHRKHDHHADVALKREEIAHVDEVVIPGLV